MKIAFLYAGQGSQKVGMGLDFYEQNQLYKETIDMFDIRYRNLMHKGPMEELSMTRNTQPCMALFGAAITKLLFEKGIRPDYVAGLSLGEYNALYAAGVLDEKTLIDLVAFRGNEMEKAAKGIACKMTAVLGAKREVVEEECKLVCEKEIGYVTIANYNCPGQYVICGEEIAVNAVENEVLEKGAKRCIPLKVSGPFHTKYMKAAGDALREKMKQVNFFDMEIPVVFNATGRRKEDDESMVDLLEKQVQESVYFEDCIRTLIEAGVDTLIEIGPGKVLSGFVKKVSRDVTVMNIENYEDFENISKKLEEV